MLKTFGYDSVTKHLVDVVSHASSGNAFWFKVIIRYIQENSPDEFVRSVDTDHNFSRTVSSDYLKFLIVHRFDKLSAEAQQVSCDELLCIIACVCHCPVCRFPSLNRSLSPHFPPLFLTPHLVLVYTVFGNRAGRQACGSDWRRILPENAFASSSAAASSESVEESGVAGGAWDDLLCGGGAGGCLQLPQRTYSLYDILNCATEVRLNLFVYSFCLLNQNFVYLNNAISIACNSKYKEKIKLLFSTRFPLSQQSNPPLFLPPPNALSPPMLL